MSKLKNYLLATAGLVILGGAFTVIGPYVDLGHSKPPSSGPTDVNIVNTPLPVVVENGEPAGEKDVAILVCSGSTVLTINSGLSSFSLGAPALPGPTGCARVIAFYIEEGFRPLGEGNGYVAVETNSTQRHFSILMTRNIP